MDTSRLYANDWLRAKDFAIGEERNLTIHGSDLRDLPDGTTKVVVTFSSGEKFALNRTNARTLAKLFGDESQDWHGRAICVFCIETTYGNEVVHGLRMRRVANEPNPCPITPASAQAELQRNPPSDGDLPF